MWDSFHLHELKSLSCSREFLQRIAFSRGGVSNCGSHMASLWRRSMMTVRKSQTIVWVESTGNSFEARLFMLWAARQKDCVMLHSDFWCTNKHTCSRRYFTQWLPTKPVPPVTKYVSAIGINASEGCLRWPTDEQNFVGGSFETPATVRELFRSNASMRDRYFTTLAY